MTHTITVRLTAEQAKWLEEVSRETGIAKSDIVRQHLEQARSTKKRQRFLRLAGAVSRDPLLSTRKGYSRK